MKHAMWWMGAAVVAAAAGGAVAQPEKILDTATGWGYIYGADETTINAQISAGSRPFSISRQGTNSYDVLFVSNSGAYAATGSDLRRGYTSAATLNSYLSANNKRIIDLECYNNGGTINMDVLVVDNSGSTAAAGWSWGTFPTLQAMIDWQAANGQRPIDVDSFLIGSTRYYSCVTVPNTGANFRNWWWALNATPGSVQTDVNSTNGRIIDADIVPGANGSVSINAIVVTGTSGADQMDYAMTGAEVAPFHNNAGARLTVLERYTTSTGSTWYMGARVDNANAEERRIRDLYRSSVTSGILGFSRKRVGGGFELSFNGGHEFEPASTMKIVHAAYAVDQFASNNGGFSTQIYCEDNCDENNTDCPTTSGNCSAGNRTIGSLMTRMLTNSDNNATEAFAAYYGRANMNTWLADRGLGIRINHVIGCLCGNTPNEMSPNDAADLYEMIFDGSLFSDTWQDQLKSRMFYFTGATVVNNGWLNQMINQERANTDLTDAEFAAFLDGFEMVFKDGGYTCGNDNWGGGAGWASIPFRGTLNGLVVTYTQEYSFALLFDNVWDSQVGNAYMPFHRELLREPVRAALQSWDAICAEPNVTGNPQADSVTVGGTASFSASLAAGPATSGYVRQWQKSTNNGSTWTTVVNSSGHISGATTGTLSISNAVLSDAGLYRMRVTSNCGTDYSASAALTVTPACTAPTITTQPVAQTVTSGEDAVFTIAAGGSSAGRTYLWQKAPSSGGIYTSLSGVVGYSGVTTPTLTVVGAVDADEALYRCRVVNDCGTVFSTGVGLTVEPACVAAEVTDHPDSVTVEMGGEATFSIIADGSLTNRTYQWQKRQSNGSWLPVVNSRGYVSGAGTDTLRFLETLLGSAGTYRCVVTNDCGTDASASAVLTVTQPPPPCGTADFNGDGDIGTDQDIEAFFACIGGHCCSTCYEGGSDFNGDGDSATDQDIESFFRVLGGGAC
ncbi:MAG TPA: serine hydrolase [Phycisphaerales bacterium]|nr:serine hydrolase [Phycisphaerales bacterium]